MLHTHCTNLTLCKQCPFCTDCTLIPHNANQTETEFEAATLQKAELSVTECGNLKALISANQICAIGETNSGFSVDSCIGDSGGGLFSKGDFKRSVLVGVVSFGYSNCHVNRNFAETGFPGVYTNILEPDINNWIVNQTQQRLNLKVKTRNSSVELCSQYFIDFLRNMKICQTGFWVKNSKQCMKSNHFNNLLMGPNCSQIICQVLRKTQTFWREESKSICNGTNTRHRRFCYILGNSSYVTK